MHEVDQRCLLAPATHLLTLRAPAVASRVQPGQSVVLQATAGGPRLPLSVVDWDREAGLVSVVFVTVSPLTAPLAELVPGDTVAACHGPQGPAATISRVGTVVCCGGCYGIGALYPFVRAHHEAGNEVICLLEAATPDLLYWVDRHRALADEVHVLTSDAQAGDTPPAYDVLQRRFAAGLPVDAIHAIGCTFLQQKTQLLTVARRAPVSITLSPLMVDGQSAWSRGHCAACDRPEVCGRGAEADR